MRASFCFGPGGHYGGETGGLFPRCASAFHGGEDGDDALQAARRGRLTPCCCSALLLLVVFAGCYAWPLKPSTLQFVVLCRRLRLAVQALVSYPLQIAIGPIIRYRLQRTVRSSVTDCNWFSLGFRFGDELGPIGALVWLCLPLVISRQLLNTLQQSPGVPSI
jgi:hypothetical protein